MKNNAPVASGGYKLELEFKINIIARFPPLISILLKRNEKYGRSKL